MKALICDACGAAIDEPQENRGICEQVRLTSTRWGGVWLKVSVAVEGAEDVCPACVRRAATCAIEQARHGGLKDTA